MKDRVREIRGLTGGKELYCIDFQNDGELAGGCVAGGRIYCHINAAGDVEPCVFIHYSSAINVQRATTIIDAVKSGLVDTVSDMIWTWSVPHFEANQMLEE